MMTNLESIQENISEFNISFHLRQSIANGEKQIKARISALFNNGLAKRLKEKKWK